MSIKIIDYINEEADLKPTCSRCGYSITPVWVLENEEWVCEKCLSKEEVKNILNSCNISTRKGDKINE